MPLAIIAGMPNNKARQLKRRINETSAHGTWRLTWVPARKSQAELRTVWGEVKDIADAADASGVHILAYHKAVSGRSRYEEEIRFRHRLGWLNHSLLYSGSSDEWWLDIEERLRLEEKWRGVVRPSNQRHALVLPSVTFASSQDPWTTAQRAETDRTFARAQCEIDSFGEHHRHRGLWRDENALVFDSYGPEHGHAPQSRQWKFTYQLSPGFHFDVRHEHGRRFTVVDADSEIRSFREYTNVDAHGHVRGGQ